MPSTQPHPEWTGIEIAIVGMAGRFPGADDVDAFWRQIKTGAEAVQRFSDGSLRQRGVPQSLLDDPDYVKAGVPFKGADEFDAGLFGYTPREAEQLDPQQRVFLECAWAALEHAGCDTQRWPGKVGVYAGEGPHLYLIRHLLPAFGLEQNTGIAELLGLLSANASSSLCTRVAYKLDLCGPAVTVQTACSTSLVAVHTACQALLGQDCDMALAGGVWLNLLQEDGYRYQPGAILSPDGHCRAFDARAGGTVIGSGCGIVVLKRLEDALRDGDTVHAVIKGSAMNNDGSDKVGFTAPSVNGQAEVIRAAQLIAGVAADTIGYVEAHGTGTVLGDPIEVAALTQAFRADTERKGFCALGSAKTHIGHLDAAAGVAGLIRAVLALKHRTLPPSLHFEQPNPAIDFANSPFYVNAAAQPWPRSGVPRRAGVSSFGIGGTNVHVVLEEAPAMPARMQSVAGWHVLPMSAQSPLALQQAANALGKYLIAQVDTPLADVAFTLQAGRRAFPLRAAIVSDSTASAAQGLVNSEELFRHPVRSPEAPPSVVFLLPGGGTQHANMGQDLYRNEPVFREEVDRCFQVLQQSEGLDLLPLLYPTDGGEAAADARLARIEFTQPALFVVEYAMARLWMSRGVQPSLLLGHSLGEYVAACLAGVFALEDALHLVALRGRLMQSLPTGAMTAIALPEAELAPFVVAGCDIAAVNGAQLCVLAGPLKAIEAAEQALLAHQHFPRRLHVEVASHSAMTEGIAVALQQAVSAVPRQAPRIPFLSNVTGQTITAEQATDPNYWARHLRGTVRFADGLDVVFKTPGRVLLEVGPGETLSGLARQHPSAHTAAGIWSSQAHPQQRAHNERHMAQTLAGLWCAGVAIDWAAFHPPGQRHRLALPGYAFQRRRYWVDAPAAGKPFASTKPVAIDSFYLPGWETVPPIEATVAKARAGACTLVLGDQGEFCESLMQAIRKRSARGHAVVLVEMGTASHPIGPLHHVVRANHRADHAQMLARVQAAHGPVAEIHHLWALDAAPGSSDAALERGYFSVLALVQALNDAAPNRESPLALRVIASRMADVSGADPLCPENSMLVALCKVIGQEYPHIDCRATDLVLPSVGASDAWLVRELVADAQRRRDDPVRAYRGRKVWRPAYAPLPRTDLAAPSRFRSRGVYLITGGLGGVGLAVAKHLAEHWQARLVLLGRTPVPAPEEWDALIADIAQPSELRLKLAQLKDLQALGGEVLTLAADVADPTQMLVAVSQARQRFGPLNGVIHAAGYANSGMIAQRSAAAAQAVFAPKLGGTKALLAAVRGEPLDFVLLCSSISSMAGGLGMSDYAAANAYLDAVAALEQRSGFPVVSVNWDAWRDLGMAAGLVLPHGVGMDGPEGARALERIVNGPAHAQVVISTTDLTQRLGDIDNGMLELIESTPGANGRPARSRHPRPVLQTAYVAPDGDLEVALAEVWQDMLGMDRVGVDDNLFELGGDSLLAIQLLARVRKAYAVELHPASFFKAPTLGALALLVEARLIDDIEGSTAAADTDADAAPNSLPAAA
ncbi:type I polyketide synthase [Paracidovorax valerianellae]|uniref:type I polyketide synthase n=1 Tax=Paracidovorax valerianellae TaxID=187868 RepID=UPI0023049371|nr:type I polyketide synthase [Paracidovorax valerianellae]MDA8447468.1 SDR family NAD(P)-dependent oxidoreductase [Paracidovorax valerianellae]